MEAILEICCGLDVHRDNIVACLMKGNLENKPTSEIRVRIIGACHLTY